MAKVIKAKQIRGTAQTHARHKTTLKALGLHGIGTEVYRKDTRAIRGMLNQIQHLVKAEQVEAPTKTAKKEKQRGYSVA